MRVSFARGSGSGRGDCEYIATGGADWIEKLVLCSIEIANLGNGRPYRVTSCLSMSDSKLWQSQMKHAGLDKLLVPDSKHVQKYIPHRRK